MNIVRYAAAGASVLTIIAGAAMPAGAVVVPPVKPKVPTLTMTAVKNCGSLTIKNPARWHNPGLVVHPYTNGVYKTIPTSTLVTACLQAALNTTSTERANTVSWAYAKLGQKLTGTPKVVGVGTPATLVGAAFLAAGNPVYIPRKTVSNYRWWTAAVTEKYGARTTLTAPVSVALPLSKPGDVVNLVTILQEDGTGQWVVPDPGAAGLNAGNGLTLTLWKDTVTLVPTGKLTDPNTEQLFTGTLALRTYTMPAMSAVVIKPPAPNPTKPPNAQPY